MRLAMAFNLASLLAIVLIALSLWSIPVSILAALSLWSVLRRRHSSFAIRHSSFIPLHAAPPKGLVALKAISNAALAQKDLPGRLKLLNWGVNETTRGPVTVGDATLRHLGVNQAAHGYDHVALDYNHNSLPGHPNFKPDPREVAAYGAVEVVKDDGIYLTGIEYTPSGVANAANYRDLSPTPLLNTAGEVIFLHSVALCPQGAVKDLSFYSAADADLKALDTDDPPPTTATTMDYRKLICAMLDLDPDKCTDDQIAAAAHKAAGDKKDAADAGKPEAMSARVDSLERDFLIANGLTAGKIIPEALRVLPLSQLRPIIAALPAGQVPTDRRTPPVVALSSTVAPSPADEEVRQRLGLSKEQWAKHNA
jgi:hypothetical protein